jgi:hypothetical protein
MSHSFLYDFVVWPTVCIIYFLPLYVGWRRRVPGLALMAGINALLGWTMWGWLVAMGLALREATPAPAAKTTRSRASGAPGWGGPPGGWAGAPALPPHGPYRDDPSQQ